MQIVVKNVQKINEVVVEMYVKDKKNTYRILEVIPTSWLNAGWGTDCLLLLHTPDGIEEYVMEGGAKDIKHPAFDEFQVQAIWELDDEGCLTEDLQVTIML